MLGAYVVIAFCGSFRGNEVFLADMHGAAKYLIARDLPLNTVIIPLLGRFKGEPLKMRKDVVPLSQCKIITPTYRFFFQNL